MKTLRLVSFIVGIFALGFAPVAGAKPRHWFTDPKWWGGEVVIGLSTAADGATTAHGLSLGLAESNPLLGGHPRNGVIIGAGLSYFAIATAIHVTAWKLLRNDPNKVWRNSRYFIVPAESATILGGRAIHNARLTGSFPQ